MIVGALILLIGTASGNLVVTHIMVKRYLLPDLVIGRGPTQSIIPQWPEWASVGLDLVCGWVFQLLDKYDRISNTLLHPLLIQANKNVIKPFCKSC